MPAKRERRLIFDIVSSPSKIEWSGLAYRAHKRGRKTTITHPFKIINADVMTSLMRLPSVSHRSSNIRVFADNMHLKKNKQTNGAVQLG